MKLNEELKRAKTEGFQMAIDILSTLGQNRIVEIERLIEQAMGGRLKSVLNMKQKTTIAILSARAMEVDGLFDRLRQEIEAVPQEVQPPDETG